MPSPMALTRCLPVLLLVAMTATTGASGDRAYFDVIKCYPPPTPTADSGCAFRENLFYLLEVLPGAAAPMGFASLQLQTAGRAASDRALVRGLCFGDSGPKPCRRCLANAGKKITEQCGDSSRRASFWDEGCYLGYADGTNSSASADDDFGVVSFSGDAVLSPDIVRVQRLVALAQSLAPRVSDGSVATADATTPASKGDATAGNRTVRVLAQCARDRGEADCALCLREASLGMARSWAASGGAKGRMSAVLGSNCYLRFEILSTPSPLGEMIRTLCAAFMKGVVVGVLIGMVVVGLMEVYDRMRKKARNNRKAAVEAMSGIRTMK